MKSKTLRARRRLNLESELWIAVVDGRPTPKFSKIKPDNTKRPRLTQLKLESVEYFATVYITHPAVTGPVWDRLRYLQEVLA